MRVFRQSRFKAIVFEPTDGACVLFLDRAAERSVGRLVGEGHELLAAARVRRTGSMRPGSFAIGERAIVHDGSGFVSIPASA